MEMYEKLPRFVIINNEEFKINTDFRIFIEFETEMQGKDTKKAITKCLMKFYPAFFKINTKEMMEEAIKKFLWFYQCGNTQEEETKNNGKGQNLRLYDYKIDRMYIYSAFYQMGVDLSKKRLHWWTFRALFLGLDNNCKFCKIMSYRAYNGKDKDILELKEKWKLPLTEKELDEKNRLNRIYEQLKEFSS